LHRNEDTLHQHEERLHQHSKSNVPVQNAVVQSPVFIISFSELTDRLPVFEIFLEDSTDQNEEPVVQS